MEWQMNGKSERKK